MKKAYVITGASGLLGQVLSPYLAERGNNVRAFCHTHPVLKKSDVIQEVHCDLKDRIALGKALDHDCDVLIHTAGLTSVDKCETSPDEAFFLNTDIPVYLAEWCACHGKRYVFISSDHVTGGQKPLFSEEDAVAPVNVYAQTKAKAERDVLAVNPDALVLRTNFFGRGPEWRKSLTDWLWDKAVAGETIPAFTDSYFSPISVVHLTQAIADLSVTNEKGVFHVGGSERLSKYDFALKFVDYFGFDRTLVQSSLTADAHLSAPRPADMSMGVRKVEKALSRSMPTIIQGFQSIESDYIRKDEMS